jgi:hypothetical protein
MLQIAFREPRRPRAITAGSGGGAIAVVLDVARAWFGNLGQFDAACGPKLTKVYPQTGEPVEVGSMPSPMCRMRTCRLLSRTNQGRCKSRVQGPGQNG